MGDGPKKLVTFYFLHFWANPFVEAPEILYTAIKKVCRFSRERPIELLALNGSLIVLAFFF